MTILDKPLTRVEASGKHRAPRQYVGLFRLAWALLAAGFVFVLIGLKTPAGILISAASVACIGHILLMARKFLGEKK